VFAGKPPARAPGRLQGHGQQREEGLHDRSDEHGVEHCAQPDHPAEGPSHHEYCQLDGGAHHPDASARPGDEPGHETVPGSGTELAADVHRTGQPVEDDAAEEQAHASDQPLGRLEDRERGVGGKPDHEDVCNGAEPWPLAQRDPQQEHDRPHDDDDRPEAQGQVLRDAVVEDVPRVEPKAGAQHHRH
jgi:hypothetical protein